MAATADDKVRSSVELADRAPVLPTVETPEPAKASLHPAVYVATWISLSSSVILFNKWILDSLDFRYPVVLTTYHLSFATVATQLLARYTKVLDGRKNVKMTGRVYLRAIVPIGIFFSLSLICGNLTYLYLSVSFIQMLKATTPVAVLLSSWVMGIAAPNLKLLLNVSAIVIGVVIASFGEIKFVWIGFFYQLGGIIFEAIRLNLVQALLSSAEYKMDPLVSLYYFAPICAGMNGVVALIWEVPRVTMSEVYNVGLFVFFINGLTAFLLNVSVVFLIGKTSSLVMTLCGVLKDVLLVFASMMIWGHPVTGLQFFGYSIALGGMVYYKLGYDALKGYAQEGGRQWAEFGAARPALRKIIVAVSGLLLVIIVFTTVAPASYIPAYSSDSIKGAIQGVGFGTD
ncbi:triose-phosphate transporter family-domain-containing protein [Microdochium trichocladiopsis]|uniref:Triose-phosphate transporter family-domain-containing protein n=1 Tax=Microdochium trichocladiopsis TaxID=1682393 RepID=A0A9P8YIE7_9PEZI|nr:triose-phosphate transporter family-domain-containing protein [Microdochium trichocladiopsis]KAH7040518.1 triose-phosphate transporter family-domain-containing protein [Microdochium trichocladiopsis]